MCVSLCVSLCVTLTGSLFVCLSVCLSLNVGVFLIHVFSANDFKGTPEESQEMRPQWFSVTTIPYQDMWPDDKHWLPLLLGGKNFEGDFYFRDSDTLVRHTLKEVQ